LVTRESVTKNYQKHSSKVPVCFQFLSTVGKGDEVLNKYWIPIMKRLLIFQLVLQGSYSVKKALTKTPSLTH